MCFNGINIFSRLNRKLDLDYIICKYLYDSFGGIYLIKNVLQWAKRHDKI